MSEKRGQTWIALNEGIRMFMSDLRPICAEYVLETLLGRTDEIRVLVFDLQHVSRK